MLPTVRAHYDTCLNEFIENVLNLRQSDVEVKPAFGNKQVITYFDKAIADVYFFRAYDDISTEYAPCAQTMSEHNSYCVEDISDMRYVFYAHDYAFVPASRLLEDSSHEKESSLHIRRCG